MAKKSPVLKNVLSGIKPDQDAVLKKVKLFLKKVNAEIRKKKIDAEAVLGGSIAKDTNLAGDHDCDVFVRFNYEKYEDKDISKLLKRILAPFKAESVHGSRDYFHIRNRINYEIVPVLAINDPKDALNVTDMSPSHVAWVNKYPKMKDEIRLSKQFAKANHIYGAESYIQGFSGHVLDILTIHYGGFIKLLEASKKWKDKDVIDPTDHFKGKALEKLNRAKIDSALIVIDPVFPDRNAAAALSKDKCRKFAGAAKEFLDDPATDRFTVREITVECLKEQHPKNLIIIRASPLAGKEDVVGAKLMKAFQSMRNQFRFYDFKLDASDWHWNKGDALFWFVVKQKKLLPLVKHVGPPLDAKKNVRTFKEKHSKTFVEKGRICTYVPRAYTDVDAFVHDLLSNKVLFREKTKRLELVGKKMDKKTDKKMDKKTDKKMDKKINKPAKGKKRI